MHTYNSLLEAINDLLPQTQCGQCGFKGCRPYAEAIANGQADINQCPPGGDEGIASIAQFLGRAKIPLNTDFGQHKPKSIAVIHEDLCIGCVKCIVACPVDAILGTSKQMHTVITEECTGCELCIAPCPVDCISMLPLAEQPTAKEKRAKAAVAKQRYALNLIRKQRDMEAKQERANRQKAMLAKLKIVSKLNHSESNAQDA